MSVQRCASGGMRVTPWSSELGWTVDSLIYDGLHVRNRADGADLEAALRAAEQAVLNDPTLRFRIQIKEKQLQCGDEDE